MSKYDYKHYLLKLQEHSNKTEEADEAFEMIEFWLDHCNKNSIHRNEMWDAMLGDRGSSPCPVFQVLDLMETKKYIQKRIPKDFIYDRTLGLVLMNLDNGCHETVMTHLVQFYLPKKNLKSLNSNKVGERISLNEVAELFVTRGLGFHLSSVRGYGPPVIWTGGYPTTSQEKIIFGKLIQTDKSEKLKN